MKVKVRSVEMFELFAEDGSSLGLFKVADEWEGLKALESVEGKEKIILNPSDSEAAAMIRNVFGEHRADCEVVRVTARLATSIKAGSR